MPTYTLVSADGFAIPSFLDTMVLGAFEISHSAQTFDLDHEGTYLFYVNVYLTKTQFANSAMTPVNVQINTDVWAVTVDICDPLPCNYNRVLEPESGALKPIDLAYRTDGNPKSTSFEYYLDEVSYRCYSYYGYSEYQDLCGSKLYWIEQTDGSGLPATMGVKPEGAVSLPQTECNDSTRLCTVTASSTDNSVYGIYEVRVHVNIPSAVAVVPSEADESSVEFSITLQRSPICEYVEPSINSIVPVTDCDIYECPSDFTIYTVGEWGSTTFDSWNDTYTEECYLQNGRYSATGNPPWTHETPFKSRPVLSVLGT